MYGFCYYSSSSNYGFDCIGYKGEVEGVNCVWRFVVVWVVEICVIGEYECWDVGFLERAVVVV